MGPLHASTIRAHAPAALLEKLTQLATAYGGRGHTLFFALSGNFPRADDLLAVVNRLNTFHDPSTTIPKRQKANKSNRGHTVGCLADVAPGDALLSCAVAVFDTAHCVPFQSTLAGRLQPQVGRWHTFRKHDDGDDSSPSGAPPDWIGNKAGCGGAVDWESVWNRSSQQPSADSLLPAELQNIPPYLISTLLTLSSPHPDALTRALSTFLLQAPASSSTALTLTAAPTHFTTGRPVTLFLDGKIYGDGAVGVALLRDESALDPTYRTEFVGVKKLGKPMLVTSREGNMINALDGFNPTRLLLSALDAAGIGASSPSSPAMPLARTFKEDAQFALGVLDMSEDIIQTYKITAGDPAARGGSLALDAPRAPGLGSSVQFLHCPSPKVSGTGSTGMEWTVPRALLPSSNEERKQVLAFITVPEPTGNTVASESVDSAVGEHNLKEDGDLEQVEVLKDAFIASSTQGFVISQTNAAGTKESDEEEAWACSLPGGAGVLEWQ